jgi:single-strand selective monofunctional uracil DNA glycosylase
MKPTNKIAQACISAAEELADAVDALSFCEPTTHIYNPLRYAWAGHHSYLVQHATNRKKVLFLGMNPGPFGMAQTGVPFGEVAISRDWVGVDAVVERPANEHPKRPIEGFACARSEVSGRRLWGLFSKKYSDPRDFFADHLVVNYCPLVFMESTGRNRTPDKLPASETAALYAVCNVHLNQLVDALKPSWVIGVGAFAEARARASLVDHDVQTARILHPSPASPAANRGWAEQAEKQLFELGVW